MNDIPYGSIVLLIVLDTLLVLIMSAVFGVVVARAAGARAWLGLVVGVFLPILGPLVWSMVAISREPSLAVMPRVERRGPAILAAVVLLGLSALLFLGSATQSWGDVSGTYEDYALGTSASPADTGVGLFATVGSAALLLVALFLLLLFASRRRIAMVTGFIAGAWLLATLDGWIILSALDGVAHTAEGVSGGRVIAEASPSAALWLCLAAAVLALVATVLVLVAATNVKSSTAPARSPSLASHGWAQSDSPDWGAPIGGVGSSGSGTSDWGLPVPSDWGEGDR